MAGVWRINLFCVPCVWQLFPWQERGVILFSLFYSSSRIHIWSHTQSRGRNSQACAGEGPGRKRSGVEAKTEKTKMAVPFSTLPCLTWAVDLNDIVNKMFLYFLSWKIKPSLKLSLTLLWISSSFLPFLSLPPSFSVSLFNKEPLCLVKQKVPWSHFTLHQNVTGLRWHNDHSVGTKNLSYFISTFEELV